jgi:hypothetical protein
LAEKGWENIDQIKGIAYRKEGKIIKTSSRSPVADLDTLPIPARCFDDAVGVDTRLQAEFLITSRGCPSKCSFCTSPDFWGSRIRFRSPWSIVDEISFIKERYGLIYFSIRDDTFTADRERVIDFCKLLLQKKVYILWNCQSRVNLVDRETLAWMKRAGCECIQFGIESGSRKILDSLGKKITREQMITAAEATRATGILLSVYLITGVEGESEDDLKETVSLLYAIKAHDGQVSPLVYYPGTKLFVKGVASGNVAADLFEADRSKEAFLVRTDPFVTRSTRVLLEHLMKIAGKNHFTTRDFLAHDNTVGFCHSTNIMAGEMYESAGNWRKAEARYREIIERQPENPWGWLKMGEFFRKRGNLIQSRQALGQFSRLVPAHAPLKSKIGEADKKRETFEGLPRVPVKE